MGAVLVVLPVFLVIALGYLLHLKCFFSPQTMTENNRLLYYLAMPAILFRGVMNARFDTVPNTSLFALSVCLPYAITTLLVWVFARKGETRERFATLTLSATRGNHFFAGLPILALAMGAEGVEAGAITLAFSLPFLQFTSIGSGQLALLGKVTLRSLGLTALRLFKNPLFLSCLFALVLVFGGLGPMPKWVDSTLKILADISTGLALLMLGAKIQLASFFSAALKTWKMLLFKQIIHPIVFYLVLRAFGLPDLIVQAGTLLAAMPEAVNTAIIAREMGMDDEYCAMGTTASVLLSMFTLPVWIALLGAVQ